MHHDFSAMWPIAVLEEIKTLPRPQHQMPATGGHRNRRLHQGRLDVGGHIVWSIKPMHQVIHPEITGRNRERDELYLRLKPLQIDKSPLAAVPRELRRIARWVEPKLVAEVAFTEITPDGSVRHPSFQGLREDKDPRDVHLERAV